MKKTIRLLSAVLVLAFILSSLISCAETQSVDETSAEPSNTSPAIVE